MMKGCAAAFVAAAALFTGISEKPLEINPGDLETLLTDLCRDVAEVHRLEYRLSLEEGLH